MLKINKDAVSLSVEEVEGMVNRHGDVRIMGWPNLITLPDGLNLPEKLWVWDCPQFIAMPGNTHAYGDIVIRRCPSFTTMHDGVRSSNGAVVIKDCPLYKG